jgi:DNA adenine methylase
MRNPCYGQLLLWYSKFSQMILRRLGSKSKIAQDVIKHFPEHEIFVDMFFGAGGIFFNKPKVKYNILNDIDSDVFNLYNVVSNSKDELKEAFEIMPIHTDLFDYWKQNKEVEPIRKAIRFLMLSNFGYMGKPDTLKMVCGNEKTQFYKYFEATYEKIKDCRFMNFDFRKVLNKIDYVSYDPVKSAFIYADPPYLGTNDNYSNSFTKQDSIDLFDCLQATKCKFAMSEFDNEFILNQAKERGLNVIIIGERKNLKNRRTEILITNYEKQKGLFD